MFPYKELKSIHLEISTRCQASCPMCPRKYHGGIENTNLKMVDWTIDEFKQIFTSELLNQLDMIYFCGNFGDPIMNDDLILMCQHIKDVNPRLITRIHTNGGARSVKWWTRLYHSLTENHLVCWGIDGLEDTNHIYRIGVNFDILIRNAMAFNSLGGNSEWVFIKFKHNEHQAELVEQRSKELGFKSFSMKNTTRFVGENRYSVLDSEGNILYYLEPPSDNRVTFITPEQIRKASELVKEVTINCYVQSTREIYIDANKDVFPCCFLSSSPYTYQPERPEQGSIKEYVYNFHNKSREQYSELVSKLGGLEQLSALTYSVKEILERESWQTVWDHYWNTEKLYTCARVCGKTTNSKPKDQFVKRTNND